MFHNIKLWDISTRENVFYIHMSPNDFFKIKNLLKKTKVKIKIIEKKGIGFWYKRQAKRRIFLIVPLLGLFLLWMASHFLWSVEITGNERVTDDLMQDFLKQHGIYYGMPLKKIPMYDLKTDLRNQYDEITWVSMKLNGTCLDISVKENQDIYSDVSGAEKEAMSLIAPADGVIEQILLREGTVLKKEGDEVRKGEVIIEGKVNIPAEDGTIKETRYCKADGDVWILYDYPVSKKLLLEYKTKIYTGKEMKKILIYGKKSKLGLDLRKIPYLKYDYIEETIELPLLDILSFPLEIKKITYRDYIIQKKKYTLEEANKILSEELDKIITSLEEKGVQIIEKNVKINTNSVNLLLSGTLKIRELCDTYKELEEIQ